MNECNILNNTIDQIEYSKWKRVQEKNLHIVLDTTQFKNFKDENTIPLNLFNEDDDKYGTILINNTQL